MERTFHIANNFKFNSQSLLGEAVRELREAKSRERRGVPLAGGKLLDHMKDVLLPNDLVERTASMHLP